MVIMESKPTKVQALIDELLSASECGEVDAWLKQLTPFQLDALIQADGRQHYRMLTATEQALWDMLCGKFH